MITGTKNFMPTKAAGTEAEMNMVSYEIPKSLKILAKKGNDSIPRAPKNRTPPVTGPT